MRTYTGYETDIPRIIGNSLTDNITWAKEMVMDSIRYLVTKFYFNERTYTFSTVAQTQFYNLPPQVKKLINVTVSIGGVLWQPKECPSREYWDNLNVITFYSDFPQFFFVYNGQVGIFPIPASANTATLHYKTRIADLSMSDVTSTSTGQTITATSGSTTLLTSGTTSVFTNWMAGNYIRIPHSTTNATNGDNLWYPITSVTSGTQAVLANPYAGSSVSGAAFTIGEVPILPEDYQDLPLYRMGTIYYTTRFPDPKKADEYKDLYDRGYAALNEEFGSKTTNVAIVDTDAPVVNPNLYQRSLS